MAYRQDINSKTTAALVEMCSQSSILCEGLSKDDLTAALIKHYEDANEVGCAAHRLWFEPSNQECTAVIDMMTNKLYPASDNGETTTIVATTASVCPTAAR